MTAGRLYLDGGAARAGRSSAAQRFEVEAGRVLPLILTPEDDRLRFALRVERPSTLRFEARPKGRPVLEAAVESGRNVYFPDDSHWNAAGHDVAAAALAEFLTARGQLRPRP